MVLFLIGIWVIYDGVHLDDYFKGFLVSEVKEVKEVDEVKEVKEVKE